MLLDYKNTKQQAFGRNFIKFFVETKAKNYKFLSLVKRKALMTFHLVRASHKTKDKMSKKMLNKEKRTSKLQQKEFASSL